MALSSGSPPGAPQVPPASPSTTDPSPTVELAANYALPVAFCLLAIPSLLWSWALALVLGVFGLFLAYQTAVIRLVFTESALDVYRSQTRIRQFPYSEWQGWRIFWPPLPILFYFREVNSIHFLPILFSPAVLRQCLEERITGPMP